MAVLEIDRRRVLEARRDLQSGDALADAAPAPLAGALRFAHAGYAAARDALVAAGDALVTDQLETAASREAAQAAAAAASAHYRFARAALQMAALAPPPGSAVSASELARRERHLERFVGVMASDFDRLAVARQLAILDLIVSNLPGAGLPGVDGAPWWDGLVAARDALGAAVDDLAREVDEDSAAQRALEAARAAFDTAQLVYEGLAEATLRALARHADLPRFVYRRDPRYRARLHRGPAAPIEDDADGDVDADTDPDTPVLSQPE